MPGVVQLLCGCRDMSKFLPHTPTTLSAPAPTPSTPPTPAPTPAPPATTPTPTTPPVTAPTPPAPAPPSIITAWV